MADPGPDYADPKQSDAGASAAGLAVLPFAFGAADGPGQRPYLGDPAARALVEFFQAKGLAALKEEDRQERWYDDWIDCQARQHLYARLLSPQRYSSIGGQLDLLRLTRFLELFGYHSPAHGYSLQVTFLGLFAILMGENDALKREAVGALEAGGLLALGVSEKGHGSDLLANEFTVTADGAGRFTADGSKYYIGNSNAARIIAVLARKQSSTTDGHARKRPVPVLFALRPPQAPTYRDVRRIRTLGVRAAYVGEFAVEGHAFGAEDVIAEGMAAWDAVIGTVTLGKFFLGFGSIGICERALAEAVAHLKGRVLYGRPVIDMPHIRSKAAHAYARLAAMKLYAYRALDYVCAAGPTERRYVLFNAVQKARVSTEGVKVLSLLSECIGAKGFEADTYFEMALRDAQLIPGLEGSAHLNLATAAHFIPQYFANPAPALPDPPSAALGEIAAAENPYLMEAPTGGLTSIAFGPFDSAYHPLASIPNVRLLARQANAFARLMRKHSPTDLPARDTEAGLALGQCLATIAYAQLVADNAVRLSVAAPLVSAMFHEIVLDLGGATTTLLAARPPFHRPTARAFARRSVRIPQTPAAHWDWVSDHVRSFGDAPLP
jgi:acyl-CoA dehydrogenase